MGKILKKGLIGLHESSITGGFVPIGPIKSFSDTYIDWGFVRGLALMTAPLVIAMF